MSAIQPFVPGTFDRTKLSQIPCPNLRTLVNEGWLTPDANGLVELAQLSKALERLGVEGLPKKVLVGGAQKATAKVVAERFGEMANHTFNIYALTGSNLDHPGDTRILRGGFNPDRLEWLLSFANADGRIGIKELAPAQKEAVNDEDGKLRDKILGLAELTALCKVYATVDKNGEKTISAEGVRSLYEEARFPDEWRAQLEANEKLASVNPQKTGLFRLLGGVLSMAYQQIGTATGRAREGMMVALGRERQIDQTSAMGLGNGMCPAGPPTANSKTSAEQSHGG